MENETPNQFLDDYAKKLFEPIKKRESDRASIYGAIGGAIAGGLGAYLISPKDKSKKNTILRTLIGGSLGGLGGSILLKELQNRKFENNILSRMTPKEQRENILPLCSDPNDKKNYGKFLSYFEDSMDKPMGWFDKFAVDWGREKRLEKLPEKQQRILDTYDKKVPFFLMSNPFSSKIPFEFIASKVKNR